MDLLRKGTMRDRIMQGPPFTAQERQEILAYCRDDVEALTRLLRHLVPTIRSLPHAHMRASFVWVNAQKQHRGVPLVQDSESSDSIAQMALQDPREDGLDRMRTQNESLTFAQLY